MSDSEQQQLPAAQVTPTLPTGADDDESPTSQIASPGAAPEPPQPRWTGSAPVRPAGTARRRDPAAHLRRDPEDTLDLPFDEDDYPVEELSFWQRWRARRYWRRMAATAAAGAPPTTLAPPIPRRSSGPGSSGSRFAGPPTRRAAPPPGYQGPPGYAPPGYAPAGSRAPSGYPAPPGYPAAPGQRPLPPGPPRRAPGWVAPPGFGPVRYGPLPPPRRRLRRWPWFLLFTLTATVACCAGVIGWAKPYVDQYPASIAAEADIPGLARSTDAARRKAADELLGLIESEQLDEQSVRLLYTDQRQRAATVVATTRFVADPEADLAEGFTRLTGKLRLSPAKVVDAGPLGGYARCATGSINGRSVVVCGWADHGSLAVGLFGGRSVEEAAAQLRSIRAAVLKRG